MYKIKQIRLFQKKKIQNIPDLMISMAELDEDSVQRVRKTAESPPRVSIIGVVALVTGFSPDVASNTVQRLKEVFPEV